MSLPATELSKAGPQLDQITSIEQVEEYRCGHDGRKVQICHIPPGNSANRHSLCLGARAVAAHVGHHKAHDSALGDYLGECVSETPPGDDGSGGTVDDGSGGTVDDGSGGTVDDGSGGEADTGSGSSDLSGEANTGDELGWWSDL